MVQDCNVGAKIVNDAQLCLHNAQFVHFQTTAVSYFLFTLDFIVKLACSFGVTTDSCKLCLFNAFFCFVLCCFTAPIVQKVSRKSLKCVKDELNRRTVPHVILLKDTWLIGLFSCFPTQQHFSG